MDYMDMLKIKIRIKQLLLCVAILPVACVRIDPHIKFDKEKWAQKEDWDYYNRNDMVDDLMAHHRLKGLSYKSLVDSLGYPENMDKKDSLYYQVLMDFGDDIDPVHTKYLVFKLNKDSIVTDFKMEEWQKKD
jgi:hypothetical protein